MREIGYHGTCFKYRCSIEGNGLDPSKSKYRSDHWLGQGVYFFDDPDKARWWATDISSQNPGCGSVVYKALIEAPDKKVLDLDDNSQLDHFMTEIMDYLGEIKKECRGKMPKFDDPKKFRALFFDLYKKTNDIHVVIRTFQKDAAKYMTKRNHNELKKQKEILGIIGIGFGERQICVSKKEWIKTTELVHTEEKVI